jgi:hypothetical protein
MPIELRVHAEDDARRIVRKLGLDVDRAAAKTKARSPIASHTVAVAVMLSQVGTLWKGTSLPAWSMFVVFAALFVWLLAAGTSREVVVGRDGIRIRWLGRTRFVPHRSIARVEKNERGVVIHTVDGQTIDLPLRPPMRKPTDEARDEVLALFDRIDRARQRGDDEGAAVDAKLLERDVRGTKEWVASLRSPERMERSDATHSFVPRTSRSKRPPTTTSLR